MTIELRFEGWEGVCEGRGEEGTRCKDRETGREKSRHKTRHGPGCGTVAGGVGEGVQGSVRAGGSAEGKGKLKMGAAEGDIQTMAALETMLGMLIFNLSVESDTSDLSFKVIWKHPSKLVLPPFSTSSEPFTWSQITLNYVEAASPASV